MSIHLQNRIYKGFADFFTQFFFILKGFWAFNCQQILSPCGVTNFSARNHLNLIVNINLNRFLSTFLRKNQKIL